MQAVSTTTALAAGTCPAWMSLLLLTHAGLGSKSQGDAQAPVPRDAGLQALTSISSTAL